MRTKHWLPVAGIVALGFMAIPAGAAPLSGVGNLNSTASENSEVQERALAPPLLVALRALALSPPARVSILLWITVLLRSGVWNLHRAATPPSAPLALVIAQDKPLIRAGVSRPLFLCRRHPSGDGNATNAPNSRSGGLRSLSTECQTPS